MWEQASETNEAMVINQEEHDFQLSATMLSYF